MRKCYFTLALLCISIGLSAQTYFQQRVDYTIDVALNDAKHELEGSESFVYTNNSPDELTFIWMHLWPNAYKNRETALCKQLLNLGDPGLYYASNTEKGYIDSLDFRVDGSPLQWDFHPEHIDIAKLTLPSPLKPGEQITITTPFRVKIPDASFSRLGHVGESYMITQWYPKPAVYDKDGWHEMPYLTQGEFYSEFGSFDVSITLPENYVVGATGDLVNGEDELEWLTKKAERTKANLAEILVDAQGEHAMDFPESSPLSKTLRYKQDHVHDFAWFADKRYHVLKGEVELPHSKRKITSWAMFTNAEAQLWSRSIEYLNDATYYYSLWNGDYPYNHVSAVDGTISAGGGMEYPNITVIGESGSDIALEQVIMHEVGHNWFYGMLGSNERDHPWMDEGINSFNENRYMETKYPDEPSPGLGINAKFLGTDELTHRGMFDFMYLFNASRNQDQPIELHSEHYTSTNYGAIAYNKAAISFDYLMAYLGEDLFDRCMRKYFETWKFKHPQPEDLRSVFEEETGKDLSWFFEDFIKTTYGLDYAIGNVKKEGDSIRVNVKNKGQLVAPYSISGLRNDSIVYTQWYEGIPKRAKHMLPSGNYDIVTIDASSDLPELSRQNNRSRTKGLFPRVEPVKLKFLAALEKGDEHEVYAMPYFGFNKNDKFQLGAVFYNSLIPEKKFHYALAPAFGFGSKSLTGYGEVGFNLMPRRSELIRSIRIITAGSRFHTYNGNWRFYYHKLSPRLEIHFKKKRGDKKANHQLLVRSHNIWEYFQGEGDLDEVRHQYNQFEYTLNHELPLTPYQLRVQLEHNVDFLKGEFELNYHQQFGNKGKQAHLRLFAGKFFSNTLPNHSARYNWQAAGQNGYTDYTYSVVHMDRSAVSRNYKQQLIDNHGGMKVPTRYGSSNDWLLAANLKIPGILLNIGAFSDIAFYPATVNQNGTISSTVRNLYDAGLFVTVIKDAVEIYFPLVFSQDVQAEFDYNNIRFNERIRFSFNIHKFQPFQLIRDLNP